MAAPSGRTASGCGLTLAEVAALTAAVAGGLALDRAHAPSLFTRSAADPGDRLAILGIILAPCVVLGLMALVVMRVILPRLRWRPPGRLGLSLIVLGVAAGLAGGLMDLVMRAVVGLAQ